VNHWGSYLTFASEHVNDSYESNQELLMLISDNYMGFVQALRDWVALSAKEIANAKELNMIRTRKNSAVTKNQMAILRSNTKVGGESSGIG
jgi:hypothetical protein